MSDVGTPLTVNAIDDPGAECLCVKEHNPNAVQFHVHHIVPLAWGGADVQDNEVLICPTTHDNIHRLLREWKKAGGRPAWRIEKNFGPYARRLAQQGWENRATT